MDGYNPLELPDGVKQNTPMKMTAVRYTEKDKYAVVIEFSTTIDDNDHVFNYFNAMGSYDDNDEDFSEPSDIKITLKGVSSFQVQRIADASAEAVEQGTRTGFAHVSSSGSLPTEKQGAAPAFEYLFRDDDRLVFVKCSGKPIIDVYGW